MQSCGICNCDLWPNGQCSQCGAWEGEYPPLPPPPPPPKGRLLAIYNLTSGKWRIVADGGKFCKLFKDGELHGTYSDFYVAGSAAFDYTSPSLLSRLFWDWK